MKPADPHSNNGDSIAIIICTEPAFEKKSLLLVRSIRRWAGDFRNVPIYNLSPEISKFPKASDKSLHYLMLITMKLI